MTFAAIAIVISALYIAREVLIPIALAVLLTFLLAPLANRLERLRLGRVVSVILVTAFSFVVLGVIGWIVANQLVSLAGELPRYRSNIQAKIEGVRSSVGGLGGSTTVLRELNQELRGKAPPDPRETEPETSESVAPSAPVTRPIPVEIVERPPNPIEFITHNLSLVIDPLTTAGIVIVFVVFFLLQREDLRDRLIRLVSHGRLHLTTTALDDMAQRISRYLLMQLVVNVTYGIPVAIGLYFIGVPNAFLWGLFATLLRFIPYVGPWIAASFPILLAFAVFNDYRHVLLTIALYVVIELISNNIIEPWLYGTSTGLSPVAVLVAAVFWAWLWGPVGLLLSTPLTVCLVVIGRYVPQLQFFDVLLGDRPVLSPPMRYYQRLLALDPEDAAEIVEDELAGGRTLTDVYDNVIIPALAMAEQDRHRGHLDEQRQAFVLENTRQIVEDCGEQLGIPATDTRAPATADTPPQTCLLCLPAHDNADEVVGLMLTQLLRQQGCSARVMGADSLASEMVQAALTQQSRLLCISALPPAAVIHARYLGKRLRAALPEARLVVGLWTSAGDLKRAQQRLDFGTTDKLVTSLSEAIAYTHPFLQTVASSASAAHP